MGRYINLKHECDYCGELARRERHPDVPATWHDGQPIKPIRNKTLGIKCADCQWASFDDFCQSQGCSASNPVRYYP
ncbi:hypothetical protein J2Y63_002445 [Shinella sp. BE166]